MEEPHNSFLSRDRSRSKSEQETRLVKVNTVHMEEGNSTVTEEERYPKPEALVKHLQRFSLGEETRIVEFFLTEGCYGERKGVAVWKRMVAEGVCPGRTWQSLKERFLKRLLLRNRLPEFNVTEDDLLQAGYRSQKAATSRRYSKEEDRAIVRFISPKGRLQMAGGNSVWKVLAAQDPGQKRSWQSLRGRFLKVIVKRRDSMGGGRGGDWRAAGLA